MLLSNGHTGGGVAEHFLNRKVTRLLFGDCFQDDKMNLGFFYYEVNI